MAGTGVQVRVISNRLPSMPAAIHQIAVREVQKAAYSIEADAKSKVAVDTGTLRRSIHTVLSNGGLTGTVGPSVRYGLYVELGTRRMGARPYLRPAAEVNLPKFAAAMRAALRGLK
jgi:HK97 gp10 family phage protein